MAGDATLSDGYLAFIRYGFMPNHLGYCGGNEQEVLFEHATEDRTDARLGPMLARFTGALPYLRTLASSAGIADPFDARVVEAYWLGNELLDRVEVGQLYRSLAERFGPDLPASVRAQVLAKPPAGAKPFHLFHVLDVYRHLEAAEVGMAAMESCRISWGQVVEVDGASLVVDRQPLVARGTDLVLGEARRERVTRSLDGRGFAHEASVGDWVSIHWGWTCEVLDDRQLANLRRWSAHHLALASETL